MLRTTVIVFSLIAVAFPVIQGCGSGDGTTVIQPGEDYQLSEAEQAYAEEEMRMRKGGGE